ncbi:MAG: hypothetical protein HQ519_18495 [Planctomycetes bacterium]|nr:hypothetical protein [Planctomycetota bacterium]
MKTLPTFAAMTALLLGSSCALFSSSEYGYAWMTVGDISFGIGQHDMEDHTISGLACQVEQNRELYPVLEFRFKVYEDRNGDQQCQAEELLASDQIPFAEASNEVHLTEVKLRDHANHLRMTLGAHTPSKIVATYDGPMVF